jgi:hypothetical protein
VLRKNQAINKTEGFVNNKANTFLNAFGAGRSEVSIGGLSSKKLNYSLRTIQPRHVDLYASYSNMTSLFPFAI